MQKQYVVNVINKYMAGKTGRHLSYKKKTSVNRFDLLTKHFRNVIFPVLFEQLPGFSALNK